MNDMIIIFVNIRDVISRHSRKELSELTHIFIIAIRILRGGSMRTRTGRSCSNRHIRPVVRHVGAYVEEMVVCEFRVRDLHVQFSASSYCIQSLKRSLTRAKRGE